MDSNLMISIYQTVGIIVVISFLIYGGYFLNKKFGNKKVEESIDSATQIFNIISSILVSNDFGNEVVITKTKIIIYETLQMLKINGEIPSEDLVKIGIRKIKELCLDSGIKLSDEQCEIAKSALILSLDFVNLKK